ncbi:diguanylate cyclase [Catellatospora methionotrophica]|uniref:Diguanylate cyclase n=1 Tax=Catellatospora methionotrophica TaxID=121620 RepID=A0A8J3LNA6_9ACTN|nr:GGDEF domain-containing protein [Catellatospora methionotrophica]GIG18441.1 diguanylate cyclase [Catellatospora methionotrophica]
MARRDDPPARAHGDQLSAEWVTFRDLLVAGRSAEAIALADRIIAESGDPLRVAQALIEKVAGLLNQGGGARPAPLLDRIAELLRQAGHHSPRLSGEYHVLAAYAAFADGSMSTAVSNLVQAERVLRGMTEANQAAVSTWHDMSVTYSAMGFHAKAVEAMRAGRRVCVAAGIAEANCACLETLVRSAVARDHQAMTEDCVRELWEVVTFGRTAEPDLTVSDRTYLRYAAARLAVLGQRPAGGEPVPGGTTPDSPDQSFSQVVYLTAVCEAIADDRPDEALRLLGQPAAVGAWLGEAEPHRLRSIALSRLGDHAGAIEAERAMLRIITRDDGTLRDRYIDSVNARLDQDRLRQIAQEHADAAMSDPLTGLPNRRRIQAFAAELAARGADAAVGLIDLDGFKAVNDTHGHSSGDLVLQRIAGLLAQSVRGQDLPARFGGDEFMVILPDTGLAEAREVGGRITASVVGEDWDALVPGTPVGMSMGWASLPAGGDLDAVVRAADTELYREKRALRPA